jgi:ectoine hydroxylase-related dioxygenase (phytanoyl-CoA dioxygenase family)
MLTAAQIRAYHDDGYLLVKGLLSRDEAAAYRQECHDLARRLTAIAAQDPTWASARQMTATATDTILQACHDVQFESAAFSRLIVDERITGVAADLIGSPNVQLHHTKMFIKPPEKGSPFPLHQDHPYFPHTRHTVLAAICHFDDASQQKGCVRVVPGSHRQGPIEHITEGSPHLPFDRYPLESAVPCPAETGDVLYFNYLTVHGSGINASDEARTTLLIQMRDPEDEPAVATHLSRGQGMMLRGIDPHTTP